MRAGLRLTSSSTIDEPGTIVAATTKNAADDGSPGTTSSNGVGAPARDPERAVVDHLDAARRSAPSIRSVWSRLGAGSTISVVPVGLQPGEHERGLHLAARRPRARGGRPCSAPPRTVSGARAPSARPSSVRAHRPQRVDDPAHRPAATATRRR